MRLLRSRRLLLLQLLGLLAACGQEQTRITEKLIIGVVSYGEGAKSIDRYARFQNYLASQTGAIIELEPALNEIKAISQIQRRAWSMVFAPPGLAAIAISKEQYIPLFIMQGAANLHSVLVVLKDSPLTKIADLAGKAIALGQSGSATGYYLPIYDLYGLTLSEVQSASTPQAVLELVDKGIVAAGALSKDEFDQYRSKFSSQRFRILHRSSLRVPPGLVLLGPTVDRNLQEQIVTAMKSASPDIASEAGYITNAPIPDYKYVIQVVDRVRPITTRIRQKPAPLYEEGERKN